ncbi:Gfo/Idh/MocA family protein [Rubinisphaera italica]|uniref:Inositol 2-dehydrogenase n=1 Tax=Rubinisphaera italica TaxID=2527969 RepID=A0A5C5XL40_9PLAN|nr:Gfo/Idh/MocA family oxidoreductase [Rubinisphaera italica]TWT63897.1 Inositol 2-dehydrogenase [Rubinisphaera italica]
MTEPTPISRRDLLKTSATVTAAVAASGISSRAYADSTETIQIALVGCGGRGTGAADNALNTQQGPVKLVAMADVFENRLSGSFNALSGRHSERMDVPDERKFIGFDAYKQAMDCLNPGDVVILTTPPAFRWVQFTYAIEKGLNVFMEKPVTVDAPTSRKMLELNEQAKAKNLKVGVGLMCRHCEARGELFDRIQSGEIGDLVLLRAYRQAGPTASAFVAPQDGEALTELMYQIKNFHGFLWASGGAFSDFLIHNIDECCWMKNDWPVMAKASGGRHYRGNYIDQNFDNYSVEYTFADGSKMFLEGRTMNGCDKEFASYAHGTKGSAVISTASHTPAKSRIYKGQSFTDDQLAWKFDRKEPNPYQLEWEHLMTAIRKDETYNEVERGVMASLVTSMGRMAAHTGRMVTRDQMLEHDHEFAPQVAELTLEGDAPVMMNEKGLYPIPMPGLKTKREY